MESNLIKIEKLDVCTTEELKKYITYLQLKPEAEIIEKQIRAAAKDYMVDNGLEVLENDAIRLKYVAPSKRKIVDTDKLRQEGILEEYQKETDVSDSVKITIRWENM